jgi:hypothetical protein
MVWIADAHRDNGKRFVVHADEKLTAFVELESLIRAVTRSLRRSGEKRTQCRDGAILQKNFGALLDSPAP